MATFNKVLILGNVTKDPKLSYLPTNTAVVEFGIATNRRWKSKTGEQKESVCFVDCRAFGTQADIMNKYLKKGKSIFIEGRLDFDQWTAQDGTKRSKHCIIVETCQFLDKGEKRTEPQTQDDDTPF